MIPLVWIHLRVDVECDADTDRRMKNRSLDFSILEKSYMKEFQDPVYRSFAPPNWVIKFVVTVGT